jgi:hypothetical protein
MSRHFTDAARSADEIASGIRPASDEACIEYNGSAKEMWMLSFQVLGFVAHRTLETGGYNYVRRLGADEREIREALEINFEPDGLRKFWAKG